MKAKRAHKWLSAAKRREMPNSDFALPGHGQGRSGKGSGAYPIDTPGRARAALSRGAANASPSELETIKAKVRAKYPGIAVAGETKSAAEKRYGKR